MVEEQGTTDQSQTSPQPAQSTQETGSQQTGGGTTIGMDPKMAALLSYALSAIASFIPGLIFYLIEKENKFIRFHALQSVLFNAALFVVSIALTILTGILAVIPVLGWIAGILLWLAFAIGAFVYWIILMMKSYQGEFYKVPIIGDWAEQNS